MKSLSNHIDNAIRTAEEQRAEFQDGLRCLLAYLAHRRNKTTPYRLLANWAEACLSRMEEGKEPAPYSTENLRAMLIDDVESEQGATQWVARQWKKLGLFEKECAQGLEDIARREGLGCYCVPAKEKSLGGTGNTSKYYFELRHITSTEQADDLPELPAGGVRYILETEITPAWWIRGLFKHGYRLHGWRRWLMALYLIAIGLLTGGYLFLNILWVFYSSSPDTVGLLKTLLSCAVVLGAGWVLLRPIIRLVDRRIIMAPESWTALQEERAQLEILRNQDVGGEISKLLRLVRYTSICPQCSAKVEVTDGGREFPDRLVGRCQESPAEHVYSFDRVLKVGKLLR